MGRNPAQVRRRYRTGNRELDAQIEELVEGSDARDKDLLLELITTCFRLVRHGADRGEMKLVNAALKEFAYAFKVFKEFRGVRKLTIFGSSRSGPEDPNFALAERFAATMAKRGWMVITGAGPGIMEAGHRGAGVEQSFGANIRLPLEAPNEVIEGDSKLINFKYFFTRKVTFLKESHAFALFPGGFGTLDEAFELLTLMQTGKSDLHPVVLLEEPGGTYWSSWRAFLRSLANRGLTDDQDTGLLSFAPDIDAAVQEIEAFYRNYESERYVDGRLVLRVQRTPAPKELARIGTDFADILGGKAPEVVGPSPQEELEGDSLECERIAFDFDRRSYSRLRRLIDRLNEY